MVLRKFQDLGQSIPNHPTCSRIKKLYYCCLATTFSIVTGPVAGYSGPIDWPNAGRTCKQGISGDISQCSQTFSGHLFVRDVVEYRKFFLYTIRIDREGVGGCLRMRGFPLADHQALHRAPTVIMRIVCIYLETGPTIISPDYVRPILHTTGKGRCRFLILIVSIFT